MLCRIGNKLAVVAIAAVVTIGLDVSDAHAWGHLLRGYGSSGGSSGGYGYASSGGNSYGSFGSSGGSWGGSSGGYASSGGSYGSYGSSGGSSGGGWGGLFHHHRRWAAYNGSYGSCGGYSYGSCGGSSGGYYSWGSSGGSSGGYGSSGGSTGGYSSGYAPVDGSAPVIMQDGTTPPAPPQPAPVQGTSYRSAMLNVIVPADAKVYVNGAPTTSTGTHRRYISNGLEPGFNYTYDLRVEFERNGKLVTEEKIVKVKAGDSTEVAFNAADAEEKSRVASDVRTSLTLIVPADAKVYLSGNATDSFGSVREFSTTKLAAGEKWNDYTVTVEVERDGQKLVKTADVSLNGGDVKKLEINFEDAQLARANGRSL